jgi:hypothetical protein
LPRSAPSRLICGRVEAKAAIKRLAQQELVEIKIKNLSEDELDRLSTQLG